MTAKAKSKKEIIINCESLETRVAFLESGHLEDYFVENFERLRI